MKVTQNSLKTDRKLVAMCCYARLKLQGVCLNVHISISQKQPWRTVSKFYHNDLISFREWGAHCIGVGCTLYWGRVHIALRRGANCIGVGCTLH